MGLPEPPATGHVTLQASSTIHTDKFDLLFVIDNSSSMADKHPWLGRAVADLVERLVNPPCVNADRTQQYYPEDPGEPCEYGRREMAPLRDVHLGFITTSLGGHGHETHCESPESPMGNDRAHLLPSIRDVDIETYEGKAFLAWDNRLEALRDPGATRDLAVLRESVDAIVESAGSDGCGHEEPLEAWYRFLVDPEPPSRVVVRNGSSTREGIDRELLEQRTAFLRPDSMVVIVMIGDENDCSVRDSGSAYKLGNGALAPGTSACPEDPDDPCCFSCDSMDASVPVRCQPPSADPACLGESIDNTNIACFDQKRRFGIDFLYPTSRYVTALQTTEICPDSTFPDADCACQRARELGAPCEPGEPVPNPLFVDSGPFVAWGRDPGQVRLVGIVGVPWQDVAEPSWRWSKGDDKVLELERSDLLDWTLILGSPGSPGEPAEPPLDALMQESVRPRLDAAAHPYTGVRPQPPEASPGANPINGHEWLPINGEDLQYACVFPLEPLLGGAVRDCNVIDRDRCACLDQAADLGAVNARKKPICQQSDGSYGSVQTAAGAQPSVRQLEVLRDLQGRAITASLCPKVFEPAEPDYLYRPVFDFLVREENNTEVPLDASGIVAWNRCLNESFPVDVRTGHAPCTVVEAVREDQCLAECSRMPGRRELDNPRLASAVRERLSLVRHCTEEPGKECPEYCLCEIVQLDGRAEPDPLWQCQNVARGVDSDLFGFCYVSPTQDAGDESVVADCPEGRPWGLRFVGEETPRNGAVVFTACASE